MEELRWRKSVRSANGGDTCVECARTSRGIAVRDSKNTAGPRLRLGRPAFARLLDEIKHGEHDMR
jgi:hypothetical protein